MKAYEKHEILRFRKYCEERINRFMKDDNRTSLQFQPLDRIYRTVMYGKSSPFPRAVLTPFRFQP